MADQLAVGDWVKHRHGVSPAQIMRIERSSLAHGRVWAAVRFGPDHSATYWMDKLVKLTPEATSKAQLTSLEGL